MAGGGGGGRGTFPKNLWVEREALSEVKVFFLRTGEWRVESGEWRVESGEWRVESGINLLQTYRPHHLHVNQPNL